LIETTPNSIDRKLPFLVYFKCGFYRTRCPLKRRLLQGRIQRKYFTYIRLYLFSSVHTFLLASFGGYIKTSLCWLVTL